MNANVHVHDPNYRTEHRRKMLEERMGLKKEILATLDGKADILTYATSVEVFIKRGQIFTEKIGRVMVFICGLFNAYWSVVLSSGEEHLYE